MLPLPQRGGGNEGEHQAAHRIEPSKANPRRDARMTVEPGETGIALQQRAIRDGLRLWSGPTETGSGDIDQPRIYVL